MGANIGTPLAHFGSPRSRYPVGTNFLPQFMEVHVPFTVFIHSFDYIGKHALERRENYDGGEGDKERYK